MLRTNKRVKTRRMKVQVEYFLFPPSKNAFPSSQRGTKSKFFKIALFLEVFFFPVFRPHSNLLALSIGSVTWSFFFWEEVIENVCSPSLSSAVSCRQQDKVIVDVDHWHVEGRHFVDTEGLVHCWVQLLDLQLPLHPLHCVEGCSLVLLPHQQTCLWKTNQAWVSLVSAKERGIKALKQRY